MFARQAWPPNSVALYELSLWPHATYYLGDRNPKRVDAGLASYLERPDVPMFIYADGAAEEATVFRWWPSDAYTKLTRNHYRVASIIPVHTRFKGIRGVYVPEREPEGMSWRWISDTGQIQLPRGGERTVTLTLGLPVLYPFDGNELTIEAEGRTARIVRLERGRQATIEIPVPSGSPVIGFRAAKSFVPAEVPGSLNRDRRRLSVKIYRIETSDSRVARQAAWQ
jgi:hypothetical protein